MSQGDDDFEIDAAGGEKPLAPGFLIDDKYVIQRVLGQGGTGTVYEAEHTAIGHRVAIKVVHANRAGRPETLARFQREARICGTTRHPNIGQIYDVGMLASGQPFMVLELHEGQSLYDVLSESILPIPAIIEITLQLLSALAAIHHERVVHRDVKPDNAMLVRALNGDIVVKLVDFGISKVITTDIRERTLTREGSIVGSPDYMSPEQLRGLEVDARTDLYSVGVLLYESVTGRTPFDGPNLTDLMAAILRDPVRPARELRPDCPVELEALIHKALSRDPAERFQSAVDMARELEHVRRVMRYTPDPGISELRKPMPRRTEQATRSRRPRRKPAGSAAPSAPDATTAPQAPPAAVETTSTLVAETLDDTARLTGKPKSAPLWIAAALLGASVVAAALWLGGRSEAPEAPPAAHGASAVPASAAPPAHAAAPVALPSAAPLDAAIPEDDGAPSEASAQRARPKRERRAKSSAQEPASESADQGAQGPSVPELLREASSAFVLGQMPRAGELYEQVLSRSPSQPDAWRGLCLVASRMGRSNDAKRAFARYLSLRPNAPDAARIREQLDKLP